MARFAVVCDMGPAWLGALVAVGVAVALVGWRCVVRGALAAVGGTGHTSRVPPVVSSPPGTILQTSHPSSEGIRVAVAGFLSRPLWMWWAY